MRKVRAHVVCDHKVTKKGKKFLCSACGEVDEEATHEIPENQVELTAEEIEKRYLKKERRRNN